MPRPVATTGHHTFRPCRPGLPFTVYGTKILVAAGGVNRLALAGLPSESRSDGLHPMARSDTGVQAQAAGFATVGPGAPVAPSTVPRAPGSAALNCFLERHRGVTGCTAVDLRIHLPGPSPVATRSTGHGAAAPVLPVQKLAILGAGILQERRFNTTQHKKPSRIHGWGGVGVSTDALLVASPLVLGRTGAVGALMGSSKQEDTHRKDVEPRRRASPITSCFMYR